MSIAFARLPIVAVSDTDYVIVSQGSPPQTRRATIAQYKSASVMSSGSVGPTIPSRHGPIKFSELPLAAQVYLNDYVLVNQGTPPITALVTVQQAQAAIAGNPTNTESSTPRVNTGLGEFPVAANCYLTDTMLVNKGSPQVTGRTPVVQVGSIWAPQAIPTGAWAFIMNDATTYYIAGWTGNPINTAVAYYSTNGGVTWTQVDPGALSNVFAQDGWQGATGIGGFDGSGTNPVALLTPGLVTGFLVNFVFSSNHGTTWAGTFSGGAGFQITACVTGGNYVVNGGPSGAIAVNLTTASPSAPQSVDAGNLAYGAGYFVGVSRTTGQSIYNASGPGAWTAGGALPTVEPISLMAFGNTNTFVAVATTGVNSYYSTNHGVSWTKVSLPSSSTWSALIYANGLFVLVSADGQTICTSPDGIVWSQRAAPRYALPNVGAPWHIAAIGANFVAVAGDISSGYHGSNAYLGTITP
jgi:hypothetical protein